MIGIFVWAIIIESIIGGLYPSVRPRLPYTAADTTLAGAKLGNAAFGPAHGLNGAGPLPFAAAAALYRRNLRRRGAHRIPHHAAPGRHLSTCGYYSGPPAHRGPVPWNRPAKERTAMYTTR